MLQNTLRDDVPYAVATEYGNGWLFYADKGSKDAMPSEDILERTVIEIWRRHGRDAEYNGDVETRCAMKAGFAIIVKGYESGKI